MRVNGGKTAYGYDPYGIPLDATPRVADIGYAGMLTEADSGLSLTPYRAYDANAGRWLSRDPLGESVPEGVNLYQYVLGNPVAFTDPLGLKCDPNPRWPGAGGPGGGGGGSNNGKPGASDGAKKKPCSGVPSPGLGGDEINRRTNRSADRAALGNQDVFSIPGIDNRIELFTKSFPGARNYTKSSIPNSAQYGNFLFGAESTAAGLSLQEALNWGANAQVFQDIMHSRIPTGSDNPGDAAAIADGYNYYQSGRTRQ